MRVFEHAKDVDFQRRSRMDLIMGRAHFVLVGKAGRFIAERSKTRIADHDRFKQLLFYENATTRFRSELPQCKVKKAELTEALISLRARSETESGAKSEAQREFEFRESATQIHSSIMELETRIMRLTHDIEACEQILTKMTDEDRTYK